MTDTDDTRLWVEVLDVVLGPALFFRTLFMMLLADQTDGVDADLPDSDVTLENPAEDLRGTKLDQLSRVVSTVIASMIAMTIGLPDPSLPPLHAMLVWWLLLNCAVLYLDPLAYAILALRNRDTTDSDTEETLMQNPTTYERLANRFGNRGDR